MDSFENSQLDDVAEEDLAAIYGGTLSQAQTWGAAAASLTTISVASRAVATYAPALTPVTAGLKAAAGAMSVVSAFGAVYATAKAAEAASQGK